MLFNFVLFSSVLLAFSVVLAHHPSQHGARMASHRGRRQLRLNRRNQDDSDYLNDIWAGPIVQEGDGTFTDATGTFTAPNISGSPWDGAAVWVGIDGNTCQGGLFQAGVDLVVSPDGNQYNAWFQWYPADSIYPPGFGISAGDRIKVTLITTSTSGIATIENLTNGQNVSQTMTNPSAPLCGQTAEWIVEDYTSGSTGSSVSFANFGTVTFTDAMASGKGSYTPADAVIYDIAQNGQTLTSVSIDGSSATIKYL